MADKFDRLCDCAVMVDACCHVCCGTGEKPTPQRVLTD